MFGKQLRLGSLLRLGPIVYLNRTSYRVFFASQVSYSSQIYFSKSFFAGFSGGFSWCLVVMICTHLSDSQIIELGDQYFVAGVAGYNSSTIYIWLRTEMRPDMPRGPGYILSKQNHLIIPFRWSVNGFVDGSWWSMLLGQPQNEQEYCWNNQLIRNIETYSSWKKSG